MHEGRDLLDESAKKRKKKGADILYLQMMLHTCISSVLIYCSIKSNIIELCLSTPVFKDGTCIFGKIILTI